MREVAEIIPNGSDPGLVAFVCTYCGAADSAIVYPKNKTSEMDLSQIQVSADLTRWKPGWPMWDSSLAVVPAAIRSPNAV